MITAAFLVLPYLLKSARQSSHTLTEFSLCEIFGVKERIDVQLDFDMPYNRNVVYPKQFLILCTEYPISVAFSVPVTG